MTVIYWVAFGEIILATLGFASASAAYFILAPWHQSLIGRNLMFLLFTVTFALILTLVLHAAPETAKATLALTAYGMFAFSGIAFAIAIILEQVRNRRRDHDDSEGDGSES